MAVKNNERHGQTILVELFLFLAIWLIYGILINSRNLEAFNLQQAGVEAMVERRQFYLEGSSTPQFQIKVYSYPDGKPFGDTFYYNGHQYAAKQPGQFMAGAFVYFLLHLFGLRYLNHYLLTSALVSFLTSSLMTAAAAVVVFRIVRDFICSKTLRWPLAGAILYALATTAFAYSGFAYHDSLAAAYLLIAFYLATLLADANLSGRTAKYFAAAAGLLLGLTLTTSMLPFFMATVVGIYFLSLRRWHLLPYLVIGGAIGMAPLLFYNAVSFGNPFLQSYIAGNYPQSDLHFDLRNTLDKVRLYVSEITLYDPIVWLGILGLVFFQRELRRERLTIVGLFAAQLFQVLNIESHGGCHYGPRFLLPFLPFAVIAWCGFFYAPRMLKWTPVILTAVVGSISVVINGVGAVMGAMYCDVQVYAFWPELAMIRNGAWRGLPLAEWLVIPLLVVLIALACSIRNFKHVSEGTI